MSLIETLKENNVKIRIMNKTIDGIVYEFEREYKPQTFARDYLKLNSTLKDLTLYEQNLLYERFKLNLRIDEKKDNQTKN